MIHNGLSEVMKTKTLFHIPSAFAFKIMILCSMSKQTDILEKAAHPRVSTGG